jgi:hypothetical protein
MPATELLTRALLLENIHPDARARLAKDGCQVDTQPRALTEDELGYVLTDIGTEYTAGMRARLQAMDVTIRLRTVDV